ncbi:3-isopropylmalate dehydratase small subunit [Caballeronia telluris]|uniref:3-isopropylmalate dehydratase n=1 Tax=Caballeronia telluris TaxID=326475 RepID=A0A158K4L1_9BURK|nr:3-isopropylmalate dehydratase small subunit [Caballeronia telluris]SAL76062.1 isopropylmalate isomerase small subunit [Caballeronia telluris]
MKAFEVCKGYAAVLALDDVDTDLIVRIERISQLKRGQFQPWAFETMRYRADGSENPDFVLNRPPFRDARILVTGANFGCGSSREMAVWALDEFGIQCVIASSYGDIFNNNCFQNGVLPIRLAREQIASIMPVAASGAELTVDLRACLIRVPGLEPIAFSLPESQRVALLNGQDDVDQAVAREARISAYQAADRAARPWVYA